MKIEVLLKRGEVGRNAGCGRRHLRWSHRTRRAEIRTDFRSVIADGLFFHIAAGKQKLGVQRVLGALTREHRQRVHLVGHVHEALVLRGLERVARHGVDGAARRIEDAVHGFLGEHFLHASGPQHFAERIVRVAGRHAARRQRIEVIRNHRDLAVRVQHGAVRGQRDLIVDRRAHQIGKRIAAHVGTRRLRHRRCDGCQVEGVCVLWVQWLVHAASAWHGERGGGNGGQACWNRCAEQIVKGSLHRRGGTEGLHDLRRNDGGDGGGWRVGLDQRKGIDTCNVGHTDHGAGSIRGCGRERLRRNGCCHRWRNQRCNRCCNLWRGRCQVLRHSTPVRTDARTRIRCTLAALHHDQVVAGAPLFTRPDGGFFAGAQLPSIHVNGIGGTCVD